MMLPCCAHWFPCNIFTSIIQVNVALGVKKLVMFSYPYACHLEESSADHGISFLILRVDFQIDTRKDKETGS